MQVIITGGSGFVGTHLSRHCLNQGHRVVAVGSRPLYEGIVHGDYEYLCADTSRSGQWQQRVAESDLIFNLAGRTIFRRWTRKYKQQIYDSRILTTRHLVEALPATADIGLISTSAVGYYGNCGETELVEEAPSGNDFLASVSRDWEAEALKAQGKGARVAILRFGIVLGGDGGALAKMVPAFKSYMGGPLGNGRQWFPWIHIDDLTAACLYLATRDELCGAFNLCAPNPVRNVEMAQSLGKVLERPAKLHMPAFMLRMMVGELAGVLLGGQRAKPANLVAAGFTFKHPDIEMALLNLIQQSA
jgi:uncharacterized protein (TIGR01777 family)